MSLSIAFVGDEPPREFRIFKAGLNTTTNGDFLFDAQAAEEVMRDFDEHGIDVMIDLEHLSLDQESNAFDPDARGWCKLEVRNGELWAVDASWTPDGEARLREKRQRYISPVFAFAKDSGRITSVLNIAITALPATDHIAPLVAARQTSEEGAQGMTPEQFSALAEALGMGPDANVEDVLATVAAMVKKIQDAANGAEPDGDEAPPEAGTPAPVVAAARVRVAAKALAKLSGKADIGEIVREVETWRESHIELEKGRAKLAQDRATLELGERRRLVGELVQLGAETPATAWAPDPTGIPDGKTPAEPWATLRIDLLRDRVAKLRAAKGGGRTTSDRVLPPARSATSKGGQIVELETGETVELSAHELAACRDFKSDLKDYARNKLIHERARAERGAR